MTPCLVNKADEDNIFEADIWFWFLSWCLVEILKRKFDQDLCQNLRWPNEVTLERTLNPRVRCALAMFNTKLITWCSGGGCQSVSGSCLSVPSPWCTIHSYLGVHGRSSQVHLCQKGEMGRDTSLSWLVSLFLVSMHLVKVVKHLFSSLSYYHHQSDLWTLHIITMITEVSFKTAQGITRIFGRRVKSNCVAL